MKLNLHLTHIYYLLLLPLLTSATHLLRKRATNSNSYNHNSKYYGNSQSNQQRQQQHQQQQHVNYPTYSRSNNDYGSGSGSGNNAYGQQQQMYINAKGEYSPSISTSGNFGGDRYGLFGNTQRYSCYSCMSSAAKPFWKHILSRVFMPPSEFSTDCSKHDYVRSGRVPTVECAGICLTLQMHLRMSGIKLEPVFLRGCYNSMVRQTWVNSTLKVLDSRDTCLKLPDYLLFTHIQPRSDQLPLQYQSIDYRKLENGPSDEKVRKMFDGYDNLVQICSCLGDRCNHHQTSGAARRMGGRILSFVLFVFVVKNWIL